MRDSYASHSYSFTSFCRASVNAQMFKMTLYNHGSYVNMTHNKSSREHINIK